MIAQTANTCSIPQPLGTLEDSSGPGGTLLNESQFQESFASLYIWPALAGKTHVQNQSGWALGTARHDAGPQAMDKREVKTGGLRKDSFVEHC